ncbi:hypothetical protein DDE19_07560 [Micromonospora ureilytica]|uniref:Uncharacterized protein n=1 Tax=Micromonospora ureilytica TaxID=709868 RepID=A0A3N9YG13_9ACTN|nr:hypothetical protein [Micromonospora ureilytica]RQX18487.1 hypothetical protein DDE19_07560 [Micromonospora ureilytica]
MRVRGTPGALRPGRRAIVVIVTLAVALPLAASSIAGARPGSTSAGTLSTSTPSADPGPSGPVTAEDRRILVRAESLLTRDCMTRAGFRMWLGTSPPADELRSFPYVVDDIGWARKHGFGSDLVEAVDGRRRANPNQRYVSGLSPERREAYLAALNGARPEGLEARLPSGGVMRRSAEGCTSEAQRRLYDDLAEWYRSSKVVVDLTYLRQRRVLADPAWTTALRPWARCLRQHGYTADTPDRLRESVGPRGRTDEIAAAVAEARCAQDGLAATTRALDARHGDELTAAHQQDVATRNRLEHGALPRARAVVAAEHE